MCGFTGFVTINNHNNSKNYLCGLVSRMAEELSHRGPDDAGTWIDETLGVALGHRRLSILDLSIAGHQPMVSNSGRFIISFNGEIYNHLEIRKEIDSFKITALSSFFTWTGHSDTETLLAAIETWGLEATLKKCVGMFAFAIWDRSNQTLQLTRDRLGEKPLYYGWADNAFLFGSELKALRAYKSFKPPVCREALTQFMQFMYVPAPRSIYQGVYKLEPGCLLTINGTPPSQPPIQPLMAGDVHGSLFVKRWWDLKNSIPKKVISDIDEFSFLEQLEDRLSVSVSQQSIADVPIGAFLSGGVDSSTIVALMQLQSKKPVKTFTIGFDEIGFDEAPFAKAVAKHLGTDHYEVRINSKMAEDVISNLPWMFDEPFADSSQIPTYLVSKAARKHVKVALSGDGGDELFGGYNKYFIAPRMWKQFNYVPFPARKYLSKILAAIPPNTWSYLSAELLSGDWGPNRLGEKVHNLANRLNTVQNLNDLSLSLTSVWQDPSSIVVEINGNKVIEPSRKIFEQLVSPSLEQPLPMMFQDTLNYLPDDILCKVDRASMACGLETRVPFLDHRIVELSWQLPLEMKVRGNIGKWALRQVLYKYVPKELFDRPKAGFAIPIGQWLRGPLREWAESLISDKRLVSEGYLKSEPIRQAWSEHISGQRDNSAKLWTVLMFQAWLEKTY